MYYNNVLTLTSNQKTIPPPPRPFQASSVSIAPVRNITTQSAYAGSFGANNIAARRLRDAGNFGAKSKDGAIAMALLRPCYGSAMALLWPCMSLLWPCYGHAMALLWLAMALLCPCYGIAVALLWPC